MAGDDAAFAELYREVNPRLSAYCHKLAPGHAEDLMQELWERVITMRSRTGRSKRDSASRSNSESRSNPAPAPRVVDSPLAFLFRVVKNLAIDAHRKSKNEFRLSDDPMNGADTPAVTPLSYPAGFEQPAEIECIILEALEKLSADDREILVLNIYSGYHFGEIAEMLGVSEQAIWQRASRARVKLRAIVVEDAKRMGITLPRTLPRMKRNEARTYEVIP